ncbi:S1 family peptidase [Streptomyces indiaensis]|uniref:S1 family peptidase n=1 Tax=Streptomyces indiaensis TaxID=284033 RepID=UPI002285EC74|nr:serine protease [Streptomyces indiaensis]
MLRSVDTVALRRFVVRICSVDGTGTLGTGFFVAPGWVMTCAHVVRGVQEIAIIPSPPLNNTPMPVKVKTSWGGSVDGQEVRYPDIALLKLQERFEHPCVVLDRKGRPMPEEICHGFGFPERESGLEPPGSPATFRFEGVEGDAFLTFKEGSADPGLSGAPLVSPGRDAVVGMMVATRGSSTSLGGYVTPVTSLLREKKLGRKVLKCNGEAMRANPHSWDGVVCVDKPSPSLAEWEADAESAGISIWTDADVEIGRAATDDVQPVYRFIDRMPVDVYLLRKNGLPNLQKDFSDLGMVLDRWLVAAPWNEFGGSIRVLWIVGEQDRDQSKGLLACLARAGWHRYRIYDSHHDLSLAARAITRPDMPRFPIGVIGLDLSDQQADDHRALDTWRDVRKAVDIVRGRAAEHDRFPLMVIAGTEKQARQAHEALNWLLEITPVDIKGRPAKRVHSYPDIDPPAPSRLIGSYYNRGLPMTTRNLFGRTKELAELRSAWDSQQTRIFTIVASGGTGKSSLINTWLGEMQAANFLDAQTVLAWSFYSQGTRDNLVSADPFVDFATDWLGGTSKKSLNPWQKGLELAALIKQNVFLLILDGLEPLQYPLTAPDVGGQLTDDSIRALLEELAKPDWQGLCVITTRVPIVDLRPSEDPDAGTVIERELENLDEHAACQLLRSLIGGDRDFRDLQPVVRDVGCHALAVTLLGNYLRDVHHGDVNGRADLAKLTGEGREGAHARRIMASYVQWLQQHKRDTELAVLRVIGLFDRPAFPEAMGALLAEPAIDAALAGLGSVGSDEWNRRVGALRGMGLLNREIPDWPGALDAHPLVREYFRDLLQQEPGTWKEGNRRLFEYYRSRAPGLPSESHGMTHLYSAVNHGCAAGLHEEVFEQVLLKRVWRDRRMNFSTRRLGMTGSDLGALSNFFKRRWTELRELPLSNRARALVMTNAGVRLRQLGRLSDARQCFGSVVREIGPSAAEEEMEDASYAAAQYCELLVIAGRLANPAAGESDSALTSGQSAVEYADCGEDPYFRMHARSSLAEVHFMLGQNPEAERLFEEARKIDREDRPRPPFLYSQSLFRYGYFLIETGHADQVLAQAERDQEWGTNGQDSSLLSKAIRLLVLGAARLSLMERGVRSTDFVHGAHEILDDAVAMFRTAGYADYSVRGLLERARFHRLRHQIEDYDYIRAQEDLDRASSEAERGQMDLLRADILLERAASYREFMRVMTGPERESYKDRLSELLGEVGELIRTMRYARRDRWLKELAG